MAPELVDLTDDSPPASPKTPTATVRTSVGSSSAPTVMQNQHQPQPLPKMLRFSSESTMGTRNCSRSPPSQLRLLRSSSEFNITRSGTQPMFNYDRLQGTLSKVHLTEAEHKLLMKQKGSSVPTQTLLASASVQSASLALRSSPPLPTTLVMITHPMSTALTSATHPIPAPPSAQPMPTSVASVPPVIAPLVVTLPVPAPLLSTPPTPVRLVWSSPPLLSAPAIPAPLMWTTSWQMPDTLKLFPVETPFFPIVSERGSSSNAGKSDNGVDLSVYRDDPAIKPGHMSWILATPEANVMVEYEQLPLVFHSGGDYGNVDDEVDLDLSLL